MEFPESVPQEDIEALAEQTNHGGSVGIGESVAVLVVDMIELIVRSEDYDDETGRVVAEQIADLLAILEEFDVRAYFARPLAGNPNARHPIENGRWVDVIPGLGRGSSSELYELVPQLSPRKQDVVIEKYKPSMFFDTQLESMLTYDGVDTLIVTGMTTSGCVRATVIDAFSYNYRVVVPEECVDDRTRSLHESALFEIDMRYGDVRPSPEIISAVEDTA